MIIRDISESDFLEVFHLNKNEIPKVNFIDVDEIKWFQNNARCFWVVEIENKIAAILVVLKQGLAYESENYRYFSKEYDDFIYVDRIIVNQMYRGKGIGRALYQKLIEIEDSAQLITCEVNLQPANEGSVEFHIRMGFKEVGQQWTSKNTKLVSLMAFKR